ncbi:acyl-CoA dehydrogenase family protein [Aquimarina sp. MMG016]|uniref:acyl-CoA dehydrogenase family protein n=1 Tax=Aquimarina sp. MMG016 TaxID=2822690 RepID=UPI001B3A238E|nr:acyl-CoA dehydrogenase family protein [Aquimarina sp. MMG016]MBQ4818988.1 acyl-CoA dehydrogenase family protein [Aquimarina sp. MMG016]
MESKLETIKGGEFLIKTSDPNTIFTPEDYTEEQHMLRDAIRDFINKEIEPLKEVFDSKEGTEIAPEILEKLGELGFLAISVPESIGGMGCDIKTDLVASEVMSDSFSFSQTLGVQRGLGVNTILFYGTEAQKNKYLDDILIGKLKCSYCLTEPGAGSDANSGKTKATLSEDGKHYILNGQKMWITNAGFADIFSVFCKIEGDENLSCLIVEKEWGVKLGVEENKLGIHGSSTRQVFFENVKVPVENLLGERNKGFKIAMNALNMGRLMIGVAGSAIGKRAFRLGVQYANQRVQFKKTISSFGAIQEKIAKMAIDIYAIESGWNRLGGDMDNVYDEFIVEGLDPLRAKQKVAQEFAAECAMIKVFGSEVEQFVVDEALQMHGGMGFSGESEISIHYRNIRGNRIYEGTNEINRLVIPGTILKYVLKGKLPLIQSATQAFQDLQSGNLKPADSNKSFKEFALDFLENCKKSAILISGQVMQKFQQDIQEQQEVLSRLADIITQVYILEGVILRTLKNQEKNKEIREAMSSICMHTSAGHIKTAVKEVVSASAEGDIALMTIKAINKLLQLPVRNIIEDRRTIATHFIKENQYKI